MRHHHQGRRLATAFALLVTGAILPATVSAAPSDDGCNNRNMNQIDKLLNCVDADDVNVHLDALQDIADANGGTRASGTSGYDESADYVAELLEAAGYEIERQVFDFSLFTENSSSLDIDGSPIPTQSMSFSESGTVTDGDVISVDLDLGLGNSSTSACESTDFDGLDFSGTNDIALMQRGTCAFATKALNAQAAGAEGAIIFNQGNAPGRFGIINGTLGAGVVGTIAIPVLDTG